MITLPSCEVPHLIWPKCIFFKLSIPSVFLALLTLSCIRLLNRKDFESKNKNVDQSCEVEILFQKYSQTWRWRGLTSIQTPRPWPHDCCVMNSCWGRQTSRVPPSPARAESHTSSQTVRGGRRGLSGTWADLCDFHGECLSPLPKPPLPFSASDEGWTTLGGVSHREGGLGEHEMKLELRGLAVLWGFEHRECWSTKNKSEDILFALTFFKRMLAWTTGQTKANHQKRHLQWDAKLLSCAVCPALTPDHCGHQASTVPCTQLVLNRHRLNEPKEWETEKILEEIMVKFFQNLM